MPIKVAIIGAGSVGFTRRIVRDVLCVPELQDTEFAFMDINEKSVAITHQLCTRDVAAAGLPATITVYEDRRDALRDADYVFSFIRGGDLTALEHDVDIPLKYGIDQCVADTLAPGGIMYGQRAVPILLGICKDISEVASPNCLMMSYSNPMAINTWACNKYGYGVRFVGLCHGVEHGFGQICRALGLPQEEVNYICAGINHQTWFIRVEHKGEDLTGKILEAFENDEDMMLNERLRIDVLRRLGYYSTESNGHLSEYLQWYRKRPEEMEQWINPDVWSTGETGGYLRAMLERADWYEEEVPRWLEEEPWSFGPEHRTAEHGSGIIEAIETGRIYRGHFNVINNGAISNLPADCCVEVPGFVDRNGINIPRVGELPMGCAAVCSQTSFCQRLAMEAAVHGDDQWLRQAMMLDPLTGAVATPPEIWQMTDELLVAEEQWLPQYDKSVFEAARKRLAEQYVEPPGIRGPGRKPVRTPEELRKEQEDATKHVGEE
ncbi:MAG: alpha-galactosidase [candidate division WS1 bacterium]|nr:alpha-galactosidase [candidate division WS1 bacterium]